MNYNETYYSNEDEHICTCDSSYQLYAEGDCCPSCNGTVYAPVEVEKEKLLVRARFEAMPKVLVRYNPIDVPKTAVPNYLYRQSDSPSFRY